MLNRLLLLGLLVVLFTGCSTTRTVTPTELDRDAFYDVNQTVRGRITELSLRDGREVVGVNVFVAPDSTSWYDRKAERTRVVATSSVERVRVLRTGRAALWGLGLGVAAGAAFGGARALYEGDDDPAADNLAMTGDRKLVVYPFAHSAYAVLASTPLGALIGSHDTFYFEPSGTSTATTKR